MNETENKMLKRVNETANNATNNVAKLFGMARQDWIALGLVISILLNIWLVYEVITAYKRSEHNRIEDLKSYMRGEIDKKVEEKVEPMQKEVLETTEEVKKSVNEFKERVTQ